ncbi:MAG: DUF368 domain-containing protein [Eubacteriales bacterium]
MKYFLSVLQGMFIGCGAILPGISGGVLMVSFGIYQPVMALFAHPIQNFKKVVPRLLPVGIGWLLGFWLAAVALDAFFSTQSTLALALFLGMIFGTLPGLYQEAGKEGRHRDNFLALGLTFAVMVLFFWCMEHITATAITPTPTWFLVAGIIWGLSITIPGLSSSTLLILMGLFEPMTAGFASLDLGVILPLALGAAMSVTVSARMANRMFHRHYAMSYHTVLGIVLASTVTIIPTDLASNQLLPAALLCCLGCGITLYLRKFDKQ